MTAVLIAPLTVPERQGDPAKTPLYGDSCTGFWNSDERQTTHQDADESACPGSGSSIGFSPGRGHMAFSRGSNTRHHDNADSTCDFERFRKWLASTTSTSGDSTLIKTADLKSQTRRELASLAKNYGIAGWHGMRKDELVDAISKTQRRLRRKSKSSPASKSGRSGVSAKAGSSSGATARASSRRVSASKPRTDKSADGVASTVKSMSKTRPAAAKSSRNVKSRSRRNVSLNDRPLPEMRAPKVSAKTARIRAQLRRQKEQAEKHRDLSTGTLVGGSAVQNGPQRTRAGEPHRDRIVLMVRDSYWLQATWEITRASVARAESSLAERWHTAKPVLRVMEVEDVANNIAETVQRDIPIHGGVDTWYIDVQEPPTRFRVAIGYITSDDHFHPICRSNIVETPSPGECERLDEHWHDIADDYERIYSLSGGYDTDGGDLKEIFEERLHRSMPTRGSQGQLTADPTLLRQSKLPFEVDAELIVFGRTASGSSVSLGGRPVKLQSDGTFTVRMKLPDKRQVLPVTAESRDGMRQRTTVIAVERNTKVMEAVDVKDNM
ncbi:hypothetical protein Mal15_13670 [Stieleria maiorica]|uniref:Rho termination factor-like N-terminal domain-containing protein n=2 Tax=Stieleria maiorica TaxID=2795974 RepID=A0A5B9MDJ8_9BACT|nr:hypothetical protein Mal15_13670 [Stieleria maiorica]